MAKKLIINRFIKKIYLMLLFILLIGNNLFSGKLTYQTIDDVTFGTNTRFKCTLDFILKGDDAETNIYLNCGDIITLKFNNFNRKEMRQVLDTYKKWDIEAEKESLTISQRMSNQIIIGESEYEVAELHNFVFISAIGEVEPKYDSCLLLCINYKDNELKAYKKIYFLDIEKKDFDKFYAGFDEKIINNYREKLKRFKQ